MSKPKAAVYVDGSWVAGRVGYGLAVLVDETLVFEACGPIEETDTAGTRQVAGELFATGHALNWCKAQGISEVHVYFDYYGIEKWATGAWKAKQPLTQRYRDFVRGAGLQLYWHKVAAHTGNRWNEHVDQLAKRGAAGEKFQQVYT